jgi:nitroreductase
MKLLTTKEAIEQRRSIRKFKSNDISDEVIFELLDSARLAPSGCNSQPWRFKIVRDKIIKDQLYAAAHNQLFVKEAPVVIVCCLDVKGYLDGTVSGVQDLEQCDIIDKRIYDILINNATESKNIKIDDIIPRISFNVAIAIEHIVLRSLDYGLGTCWVRLLDSKRVKELFNWDDNIGVIALLPIGYPNENPKPRKRMNIEDLMI